MWNGATCSSVTELCDNSPNCVNVTLGIQVDRYLDSAVIQSVNEFRSLTKKQTKIKTPIWVASKS